jgi:YD repeat-containing protein
MSHRHAKKIVMSGQVQTLTDLNSNMMTASTAYYYDAASDCSTASSNQNPTLGNLTRVLRWNNRDTSPEIRMAYDQYGNLACARAAKSVTVQNRWQ